MADYFALNPYMRRYDLTPGQQQEYGRYLLARMRAGTGAVPMGLDMRPNATPMAMTPMQPENEQPGMSPMPSVRSDVQLVRAEGSPPAAASDNAGGGTSPLSETPAANAPAQPDRRSLESIFGYPNYTPMPNAALPRPAPNYTPMPDSLQARSIPDKPAKINEARKGGYSPSEVVDFLAMSDPNIRTARAAGYKDEEILNHLAPPPSLGRRALDAAADAGDAAWKGLNTGINYAGTQIVNGVSGVAGIPRAAADGVTWLSKKTGLPVMAFGPAGALAFSGRYMPKGEDISRAFFDATGAPEVKLEGVVPGGRIIDAGVQGALTVPLTGGTSIPALMAGAIGGAGSEIAGQVAHDYDEKHGTSWEDPVRLFGDLIGLKRGHR